MQRCLALLLSILILTGLLCGCGGDSGKSGAGHSFSYTLVSNPDTLDPQLATNLSAKTVLANLFEGLFVMNGDGEITNGVASGYTVSEDGRCYTVKMRQDCYWYQAAGDAEGFDSDAKTAVTAHDFVFAFKRMFDPLYQSPYRETFACLQNARAILDGREDPSAIGVYATKDFELEFRLDTPEPKFLTLLASSAALPCNEAYFAHTKGRYGLDEASVIGNGSFAMQRWLYDPYGKYNVIQLCRNPLNHAVRRVYPVDLTFYIEESEAEAARIFTAGSTDCLVTTQSSLAAGGQYSASGAYSLTLGLIANPDTDFGKSSVMDAIAHAVDFSAIPGGSDLLPASGALPPAAVLMNKGIRELISDAVFRQYDPEQAEKLLDSGMLALGRTQLAEGKILVPADLMEYDALLTVLRQIESVLDLHLSIEEVPAAEYEKRLQNGSYTLALAALTGGTRSGFTAAQLPCGSVGSLRTQS